MQRFIEIVYDNSGSMTETININGVEITKYHYAREVFQTTILPSIQVSPNDKISIRKLRGTCLSNLSSVISVNSDDQSIMDVICSIEHNNKSTPLFKTIKDSFNSFTEKQKKNAYIIIITDGLDNCGDNIETILSKENIEKLYINYTVVLIPLAIDNDENIEKFKEISKHIKAKAVFIGDKKNKDKKTYERVFKEAISRKKVDDEKEIINEENDKLIYPLEYCGEINENKEKYTWDLVELLYGIKYQNAFILFNEGLLSWKPVINKNFSELDYTELKFLYGLVFSSGLNISVVKGMLSQLKKPYYYKNDCIYWDFFEAKWKYFKKN
jgi:hypothetical protein